MDGFIDIHTHILPSVDDGSQSMESSLKMIKEAYESGTEAIILTPHYKKRYMFGDVESIKKRYLELERYIKKQVEMKLVLGTEIMFEMDLLPKLLAGEVLTLGSSKHVLIEFLPNVNYEYLNRGIFEIISCGYIPIIAHIERYKCLNKKRVEEIVSMGAKMQINAETLMGKKGFFIKKYCNGLICDGLIDFIASDAHDPNHSNAVLSQCAAIVEKLHGKKTVNNLFSQNAKVLIQG